VAPLDTSAVTFALPHRRRWRGRAMLPVPMIVTFIRVLE
jgi:hypothetical protein